MYRWLSGVRLRIILGRTPMAVATLEALQLCMLHVPNLAAVEFAALGCTCKSLRQVAQAGHLHAAADIARGRERHPLPCVNTVDGELYPGNFVYLEGHASKGLLDMQGCLCDDRSVAHSAHMHRG